MNLRRRVSPLRADCAKTRTGAHGVTRPTVRFMESLLSRFRTLCVHEHKMRKSFEINENILWFMGRENFQKLDVNCGHEPKGSSTFSVGNPRAPMSPKGTHLNSRRCNLRWTDLTITTLKGSDIPRKNHVKNQRSAPSGPDRIVPEFHGLHPRLFMVQPAGLNSSTSKPVENVEEVSMAI